jgi:hypothetical protein
MSSIRLRERRREWSSIKGILIEDMSIQVKSLDDVYYRAALAVIRDHSLIPMDNIVYGDLLIIMLTRVFRIFFGADGQLTRLSPYRHVAFVTRFEPPPFTVQLDSVHETCENFCLDSITADQSHLLVFASNCKDRGTLSSFWRLH